MTIKENLRYKREYLISAYSKGMSTCKLGQEMDCSNASVYLFLRDECGVIMRITKNISDWDDEIRELAKLGYSGYKISKKLDLSSMSVRRYMKKQGLKTSDWQPHKYKLEDCKNEITTMYEDGFSADKIGKKFGYHETSILEFLRKCNVKVRGLRIYDVDEEFFDDINTEAKAYILGFAYGDSNNSRDSFRTSVTDRDVVEIIKREMKFEGPIKLPKIRNNCKQQYLTDICSRKLCKTLTRQGCPPNKTFKIKFPNKDIISSNLMNHFIRGIFDADGTLGFYKSKTLSCSITGTKHLLEGLQKYLDYELGFGGSTCKAYPDTEIIYKWSAGGNTTCKKFAKWLYKDATLYLTRKYKIAQKYFLI